LSFIYYYDTYIALNLEYKLFKALYKEYGLFQKRSPKKMSFQERLERIQIGARYQPRCLFQSNGEATENAVIIKRQIPSRTLLNQQPENYLSQGPGLDTLLKL
jgi:hypothetical protein